VQIRDRQPLILLVFPLGLEYLFDIFGFRLIVRMLLLMALYKCIILPLSERICPQILKMIILKVRFEVTHL